RPHRAGSVHPVALARRGQVAGAWTHAPSEPEAARRPSSACRVGRLACPRPREHRLRVHQGKSMTEIATRPEVDEITEAEIDVAWDMPQACEYPLHSTLHGPTDEPASWLAHIACPSCPRSRVQMLCDPGLSLYHKGHFECGSCGVVLPGHEFIRGVSPLVIP